MIRPKISVNFAVSADGKITSEVKKPSGWTSSADHQRLLNLRKQADALLVGKGTLLADGMTMTVPDQQHQLLRCIVSRSGVIPADHPIFQAPGGEIHVCITGNVVAEVPGAVVHHLSLPAFLEMLATEMGITHLHCEGGGELVHHLAEMDAIDEFHCTLGGHAIFGGKEAPTVTGVPGRFLPESLDFQLSHFEPRPDLGECFLSYIRRRD